MLNIELTEEDIELLTQATNTYNELPFEGKSYEICQLLQLLNDRVCQANYLESITHRKLTNESLDTLPPVTEDMFDILDDFKQGSRAYLNFTST